MHATYACFAFVHALHMRRLTRAALSMRARRAALADWRRHSAVRQLQVCARGSNLAIRGPSVCSPTGPCAHRPLVDHITAWQWRFVREAEATAWATGEEATTGERDDAERTGHGTGRACSPLTWATPATAGKLGVRRALLP
jgi:hypothetical protein